MNGSTRTDYVFAVLLTIVVIFGVGGLIALLAVLGVLL